MVFLYILVYGVLLTGKRREKSLLIKRKGTMVRTAFALLVVKAPKRLISRKKT